MGAFFTSLIKNSAIVGAMLFIYKTLALQPQGTLFNILKSWVFYTLTKTDELRRRFLSRDMLVDEGNIPVITLFHAPSDPHSTVLLQALKVLVTRYNVRILPKIVSPLLDQEIAGHSAEYKTQWEWAVKDCQAMAKTHGLKPLEVSNSAEIEFEDFNSNSLVYDMVLVEIVEHLFEDQRSSSTSKDSNGLSPTNCIKFLDTAIQIGNLLFSTTGKSNESKSSNSKINGRLHDMDKSNKRRCRNIIVSNIEALKKLGHYLPGMLYMKPDFYWGVDRLFHLEKRLLKHNLGQLNHQRPLFTQNYNLRALKVPNIHNIKVRPPSNKIVMYYSFRSPYSQLAVDRIYKLGNAWDIPVETKPVLPMVMRGLPVKPKKGFYIMSDAMRESYQIGFPWGSFSDPVGAGTIRAFVLWFKYVVPEKKEEAFLRSFSICVWSKAIDPATDAGMKIIVEKAGLDWNIAQLYLQRNHGLGGNSWREFEKSNQKEMSSLGVWGVPSFTYGNDHVFWGQDRIRALEDAIVEDVGGGTTVLPRGNRL
eukprot:g2853.t1